MRWIYLMVLAGVSCKAYADEAVVTTLKRGGDIVEMIEEQKFADNCTAKRSYPVLRHTPDKAVEKALNQRFAKILTVGKKLTSKDCPDKNSNENFLYGNKFIVGAQRGAGTQLRCAQPCGRQRNVVQPRSPR